jgi:hypothetical protein
MLAYFVIVRATLSVEKPDVIQHFAEMTHEFVTDQSESIIGHGYERFTSYITTLALFILLCNLLGLVPGFESPTASYVVPLGVAILTFVYYHYHGIRANGFSYIKQFLGPVWWLYPLMLPIEVIAQCPSLRQHVCRRHGHARLLLAHPGRCADPLSDAPFWSSHHPGLRLHDPDDGVSFVGRGPRTLGQSLPAAGAPPPGRLQHSPLA